MIARASLTVTAAGRPALSVKRGGRPQELFEISQLDLAEIVMRGGIMLSAPQNNTAPFVERALKKAS
jgi:hypothetical protein